MLSIGHRPSSACWREPEGPGEVHLVQAPLLQVEAPGQQTPDASSVQDAPGTFTLLFRTIPTPESHTPPKPPHSSPAPTFPFSAQTTPDCPSLISHRCRQPGLAWAERGPPRTGENRERGRKGHIWIPGLKPAPPSQPSLSRRPTLTSARDDFLALLTSVHAFSPTAAPAPAPTVLQQSALSQPLSVPIGLETFTPHHVAPRPCLPTPQAPSP